MIRFLLAATSLESRLSTGDCHAFASTIGTPQGNSLSPVLFTVYLEVALRDLRSRLPPRPPADDRLPLDVEYADDIDCISYSMPYLDEIERIAPACLAEWSLQINAAKTERTSISRQVDRAHEPWCTTRKLSSLLGDAEDVARRMQLANVSFHKMWTVWFRGAQSSVHLRLRLNQNQNQNRFIRSYYRPRRPLLRPYLVAVAEATWLYSAFVLPVLTYSMSSWGLTETELNRFHAHHQYSLATRYLKRRTLLKYSIHPH